MPTTTPPQPGRRIAVLGTSGCGKTFVAKRLAEILGVPYISSDAILWGPNWIWRSEDDRLADYDAATQAEGWTFDGNLDSATKTKSTIVFDRADTFVWLDLPRREVLFQILKRTLRRVWTKEELWHGNRESWRMSFFSRDSILLWSMQTYTLRRKQYGDLLNDPSYAHLTRLRFARRRDVDRWLASLVDDLA